MSFRLLLPGFLLLCCTCGSLAAQQLPGTSFPSYAPPAYSWQLGSRRGPHLDLAREPREISFAVDTLDRDYRWEGVVIGGVLLGAAGAFVASGFCNQGNQDIGADKGCAGPTVLGFFFGATIGVVTGGLIGSAIPK
jgi:hypothetical protein